MLSSIHPLGERSKGNRFWLTAAGFVGGAVAGGLALGLSGALAGAVLALAVELGTSLEIGIISVFTLIAAAAERSGRALPSLRRQVDEDWLHEFRGWVYGAGFGFQLGAGLLTYITSGAVYVAVLCTLLVGHPLGAVSIGLLFGLIRGASLLAVRRVDTTTALVSLHQRLARTAPTVTATSTGLLTLAGIGAGITLL